MVKTEINSRSIKSIAYDAEKKVMEVEFTSTMIYIYNNFPEDLYNRLIESKAIDKFFVSNVVNRYAYIRTK